MQTTNDWSGAAKAAFGFEQLKPFQRRVLEALDAGRDCLAVSPTGSGKTACFALPAALEMQKPSAERGLILVVSPLIALMHDQARKLKKNGILPTIFERLQSDDERSIQWDRIINGDSSIVFVSPERLAMRSFREQLATMRTVSLAVIDEAHCTSQWGFSLRPEYRQIGDFLDQTFPAAPRIALTATASAGIRHDIIKHTGLRNPDIVLNDFRRSNIQIKVLQPTQWKDCHSTAVRVAIEHMTHKNEHMILYAPTRKAASGIHGDLIKKGFNAALYHGGMDARSRNGQQRQFMEGQSRCMVATSAFGLGIDLPDIRHVIHAGMPQNLEQYVQETGRAGRDDKSAQATMIFHPRDFHTHKFMIEMQFPHADAVKAILSGFTGSSSTNHPGSAFPHGVTREKFSLITALVGLPQPDNPQIKTPSGGKTKNGKKELQAAMDFLLREGVLNEMTSPAPWDSSQTETILILNPDIDTSVFGAENFWRQHEFRRNEAMSKVEHMRLFATTAARSVTAAQEILGNYFEDSINGHWSRQ